VRWGGRYKKCRDLPAVIWGSRENRSSGKRYQGVGKRNRNFLVGYREVYERKQRVKKARGKVILTCYRGTSNYWGEDSLGARGGGGKKKKVPESHSLYLEKRVGNGK